MSQQIGASVFSENVGVLDAWIWNHFAFTMFDNTEALKGHRVVWKIEIYYLIRMT